jgi:hypothetical protein
MKTLHIIASLAFLHAGTAAAEPETEVRNATILGINLFALANATDMNWKWNSGQGLMAKSFIIGLNDTLSPVYNRVGGYVEYSPIALFNLKVGVESTVYYGILGSLLEFQDPSDNFNEAERDLLEEAGADQFGVAARVYAEPTLRFKAGPILGQATATIEGWRMLTGPEAFFYEPQRDTLINSGGDVVIMTSSALLFEKKFAGPGKWIRAGLAHDLLAVSGESENQRQTVGAMSIVSFGGKRRTSAFAKVNFYIQDRADLDKAGELGLFLGYRFLLSTPKAPPAPPAPPVEPEPTSAPAP